MAAAASSSAAAASGSSRRANIIERVRAMGRLLSEAADAMPSPGAGEIDVVAA
jgi:hypothetical protein